MSPRRPAFVFAALLLYAFVVTPGPFLSEAFFYGDFRAVFQPLRMALGRALAEGLPLWNDSLSHGQPLLASTFAAALYPPNALFALSPSSADRILSLLTVLHLVWGAFGAFRLARSRGASASGSGAAALVFGWSGAVLSGTYLSLLCFTVAWLPWLLLAADSAARADRGAREVGRAGTLALVTALLLSAGDPFIAASAALGVVFTVQPQRRVDRLSSLAALRASLPLALGLVLGLLLSLPLLIPAFRYAAVTPRGIGLPPELVLERSLHPFSALSLLLPEVFGSVFRLGEAGFFAPGLHDGQAPLFPSLYVGALALGLTLRGVLARERAGRRDAAWLTVSIVLALGRFLPVYPLLASLPGISSTRFPVKWLLPAMLPLALLAARGVDAVVRDAGREDGRRRVLWQGASLLGPLTLLAAVLLLGGDRPIVDRLRTPEETAFLSRPDGATEEARTAFRRRVLLGTIRTGLPAVAALLVVLLALRRRRVALVAPAIAVLVGVDLASAGREEAPTVPASFYAETPRAVELLLRAGAASGRVWVDDSPEARAVPVLVPPVSDQFELLARARREGLEVLSGASYGLRLAFPADVERLSTRLYDAYRRLVETLGPRERSALLRAASVTHVVSPLDRSGDAVVLLAEVPRWLTPVKVFAVSGALPEIRTVDALRRHAGPGDLARLLRAAPSGFVDRFAFVDQSVVLGEGDWLLPSGAAPEAASGRTVEVRTRSAARIEVRVRGAAGFLFVAGTWAPGWSARVDGREAPVLPANLAFRAVPVPAGDHVVEMTYSPF
jgi:hypothetical protein